MFTCKQFAFSFSLDNEGFSVFTCNQTVSKNLMSGAKPAAEFYVFVGVIVFLYCLAALIMYVFCDEFYRKHNACTVGVGTFSNMSHVARKPVFGVSD